LRIETLYYPIFVGGYFDFNCALVVGRVAEIDTGAA